MLIVEEDVLSQDLMKKIFKNDFETDLCGSVEEYYEKFSKTKYDVIIVDISLDIKL